ncbi:MAG: DUF1598 domain-containing protein [Planctomycetaceae bacterium]
MRHVGIPRPVIVASCCLAFLFAVSGTADAQIGFGGGIFGAGGFGGGQFGGQFGQGGQFGGQFGQGGLGGQIGGQLGQAGAAGGIMIDAKGIVSPVFSKLRSDKLQRLRVEARARKSLAADLNASSKLRKVSLVQLEKACEEYAKTKKHVPLDIQYLAGLQRIDYVFVYPEAGDIVIAGPAEGFAPDDTGRVVGVSTGKPPLRVDDLVLALRAMRGRGEIGCSIDPIAENLKALTQYLRRNSTPASRAVAKSRYGVMARILGMQNIRVWGVPAESHFGQMLVEADYRMKRISMGVDRAGVRGFRTHLSMLRPKGNSMQRWWFTPLYDAFLTTKDGNAFQLAGPRAQLLSQEELPTPGGGRVDAAVTRLSTQAYAKHFTMKFPQLAEKIPAFAELRNLFDLSIVAALLKTKGLSRKAGWKMSLFLDERRATIVKGHAPKQVHSIFNTRSAGRRVVLGLIGGGVVIKPIQTAESIEFKTVTRGELIEHRAAVAEKKTRPKAHPWWWD